MAKIVKVIRLQKFDTYGIVHVQLDDGMGAEIYIGGAVEAYFHHGKVKAFIKKAPPKNPVDKPLRNN